jgi:hypothetical protein
MPSRGLTRSRSQLLIIIHATELSLGFGGKKEVLQSNYYHTRVTKASYILYRENYLTNV